MAPQAHGPDFIGSAVATTVGLVGDFIGSQLCAVPVTLDKWNAASAVQDPPRRAVRRQWYQVRPVAIWTGTWQISSAAFRILHAMTNKRHQDAKGLDLATGSLNLACVNRASGQVTSPALFSSAELLRRVERTLLFVIQFDPVHSQRSGLKCPRMADQQLESSLIVEDRCSTSCGNWLSHSLETAKEANVALVFVAGNAGNRLVGHCTTSTLIARFGRVRISAYGYCPHSRAKWIPGAYARHPQPTCRCVRLQELTEWRGSYPFPVR